MSKPKTASRPLAPILPNLKEWLLKYRRPAGLVVAYRNVAFEMHLIAKQANQFRRAAWAEIGTAKGAKSVLHHVAHGPRQHQPARAIEPCAQLEFQSTN